VLTNRDHDDGAKVSPSPNVWRYAWGAAVVVGFAAKRLTGARRGLAAAMLGEATQALNRSMQRRRAGRDTRIETFLDEVEREPQVLLAPLEAGLEQVGS
jgi:phytoene/squalene synthetase